MRRLVIAISSAAACDLQVTEPGQTLWQAPLAAAAAYQGVGGTAAAVATDRATVAGVTVTGLPQGRYLWRVRTGTCASPGTVLGASGAYPDLAVAAQPPDSGDPSVEPGVEAEAQISAPMLAGLQYHASVQNADSSALVACGNFARQA